jgi:DNA-binding NarL/FixJ family response regulator
MRGIRWDHPDAFDHVLLLAAADDVHRRVLRERLSHVQGRQRAAQLGGYPRFKILTASSGPDTLRRASGASIAVVDLAIPKGPGLETIRELREAHSRLAILAYARGAGEPEALAAVMAGADFFHDCGDDPAAVLDHVVELAIDRRRLTYIVEKNAEHVEAARARLSELSADPGGSAPGLHPLHAREDVLPFDEAARRYLLSATELFARDPRGLADALGVSYFSLRRLLARYDVAFPAARSRKKRTAPMP